MNASHWAMFAGAALLMVLTPGPNMMYLVSRSLCQGRRAGLISLVGVVAGFLLHMLAAALGLTALFLAVPFAYAALKWGGAAYLLWLAWQAVRPGHRAVFATGELAADTPWRLFVMGFVTNVLNPKIAVFYLSILPQFVIPGAGSVFRQSLQLGLTQIAISFSVNLLIVVFAARLAAGFSRRPRWQALQRYLMGGVLATLAVRMALQPQR